jgi:hypothetical protein
VKRETSPHFNQHCPNAGLLAGVYQKTGLGSAGRVDVVLANWIFPFTGDKFSSYEAVERARDILVPHGMYPLRFWRAWDQAELVEKCEAGLNEVDGLVIKPLPSTAIATLLSPTPFARRSIHARPPGAASATTMTSAFTSPARATR